jgi:NAD(P)-dependent dehydrogenase (short-subunit alcohol dehydrogenase family)
MRLKDKVAVVTGASAGIGRAYALALAGEGATVIAAARRLGSQTDVAGANTLASLVAASGALPGSIQPQMCDVAVEADIIRMIEQTVQSFGRIDVLVNNAALMTRFDALEISGDAWDRYMATNVRGPYIAIREAAPHMKHQRAGSIISITALAGSITPNSNYPGMLPYAVSKAALNRLSNFMAGELKPYGVAVNTLSPGVVASESALAANPKAREAGTHKPATPEVLGPALICLALQTADTRTGQSFHTDEYGKSWS